jgi:predicted flavoprotein YhiN
VRIEAPGTGAVSRGGFLFTHRGWSGPALLDLSHLAVRSRLSGRERQELLVQWTEFEPDAWDDLLRNGSGAAATLLRRHLPARLADSLLAEAGIAPARRLEELPRAERIRAVSS